MLEVVIVCVKFWGEENGKEEGEEEEMGMRIGFLISFPFPSKLK